MTLYYDGGSAVLTTGNYTVGGMYNGKTITKIEVSDAATPTPNTGTVLSGAVTIGKSVTAYSAQENITPTSLTLNMSDGTTQVISGSDKKSYAIGASLPVSTTLNVCDSLGNMHTVPVTLTKSTTDSTDGNKWIAKLATDDATTTGGVTTGHITEKDGTTLTMSMPDVTLQFNTSGAYVSGAASLTMTYANGAKDAAGSQKVAIDFSTLTQYSGSNTVKGEGDGYEAGTLKSLSTDSKGVITGVYTNGVTQSEAQVAVAQFTNPGGLTKVGNNLYGQSNNSGTANVKTATDLGCSITPGATENSNVDVATEFANMIVYQRGFQANSKIITVGDEMLETVVNMKR
jgi:flagellar hook protein FlgE